MSEPRSAQEALVDAWRAAFDQGHMDPDVEHKAGAVLDALPEGWHLWHSLDARGPRAMTLRSAAEAVLCAVDAYRDAVNGLGHPGEEHDQVLADPRVGNVSLVGDCAACGGAQYGTEDELNKAIGDLRDALGQERKPWETR